MKILRNAILCAVVGVLVAGAVAGTADAANGCAVGSSLLARRVTGSMGNPPQYCRIDSPVCIRTGKQSGHAVFTFSTPPQWQDTWVYVSEWGGMSAFPLCHPDISNGPWQ